MPKRNRLPDVLLPLKNADKKFHEFWKPGRNMLNFPHPCRGVFLGPPNVGKSTTVKNILLRAEPPFETCTVIHCDPEHTKEYKDLGDACEIRGDIPAPDEWTSDTKRLVIIDDLELKGLGKEQMRNLDRLFGYVSTHKNISVMLCSQDAFNVPPIVRRCSNLWVLWRGPDMDAMAAVARKSGLSSTEMKQIFDTFHNDRDSLWIDRTSSTPYPLRKNGFIVLKKRDK
jgi:hypothetical protein